MTRNILERNLSKEDSKEKYDTLLDRYFQKDSSKHAPRERVESKIKQFKEIINWRDEQNRMQNQYNYASKASLLSSEECTKDTLYFSNPVPEKENFPPRESAKEEEKVKKYEKYLQNHHFYQQKQVLSHGEKSGGYSKERENTQSFGSPCQEPANPPMPKLGQVSKENERRNNVDNDKLSIWKREFSQKFRQLNEKVDGIGKNNGKELDAGGFKEEYNSLLKSTSLTIKQNEGLNNCYGEFHSIPEPYCDHSSESSEPMVDYYANTESQHTLSPSALCSKPPIYKINKTSNSGSKMSNSPKKSPKFFHAQNYKNASFSQSRQSQSEGSHCEANEGAQVHKEAHCEGVSSHNDSELDSRASKDFEGEHDEVEDNLNVVEESLNGIKRTMLTSTNSYVKYKETEPKMIFERITLKELIQWQQVFEETTPEEMEQASMEYKNELLKLASLISDVLAPE